MPRIEPREEEQEEFEEDGEEFAEDEEEQEEDELEAPAPVPKKGRLRKSRPKPKQAAEPPEVKRRFAVMAPQPVRIVDVEAEEVIGEGESVILQTQADILERLERIENTLGSMVE